MAGFVQIIEIQTSRIDEVIALTDEMRARASEESTVRRGTYTRDTDRAGYYMAIIEFDSYESAMQNSNRPETGDFAARMAKLCDAPPRFYNLEVLQTYQP
jgi:quinol monooxygenase YgiN